MLQGLDGSAAQVHQPQQSKMDAYGQRLGQGSPATPVPTQHPLAELLADLHYAPWQLEATPPRPPKVHLAQLQPRRQCIEHIVP